MTAVLSGWGITTDLPQGWEGRITRRATPSLVMDQQSGEPGSGPAAPLRGSASDAIDGWPAEQVHPVVHLANFPLPSNRGDFGSGAVDRMGAQHSLIVLFEYGPESIGTALFASRGMPRDLTAAHFSPTALQRRIPGQAGYQAFFTEEGRAFCLYVVLGAFRNGPGLSAACSRTLAATTIEPT